MTIAKKNNTNQISRNAKTGEFVTIKTAQRRPSTTVIDSIAHNPKKSLQFLQAAGILTPTGQLSKKYK